MAYDKVIDSAKLEAAITATADAIRAKTGSTDKIPWDAETGMSGAVESIATGIEPAGTLEITENGTYDVTEYASAEVAVPTSGGVLQAKTVYPSHERQIITPDEDYDGLSVVTAEPVPRVPSMEVVVIGQEPIPVDVTLNEEMSVSVTAEHYYTHALYNGVRLPRIPINLLAQYPYAWIRNNTTSGYYDLFFSPEPFYMVDEDSMSGEYVAKPWYRVEIATAESATEWTYYKYSDANLGVDSARTVLWSNHDIHNGSADATDIYFAGSEPVLTD